MQYGKCSSQKRLDRKLVIITGASAGKKILIDYNNLIMIYHIFIYYSLVTNKSSNDINDFTI